MCCKRTMFIEQYKLERNPFADDGVRPLFVSRSMRDVSQRLRQVSEGQFQSLFVSGVAGVGKTTLLAHRQRGLKDISLSWVTPEIESIDVLLQKLLHDIGPGYVAGTPSELSNILGVYLSHQRMNGRMSIIVADGLERQSSEVMEELVRLCQIRAKGIPAMQFVLLTRNEELAATLMAELGGSNQSSAFHCRLVGFTLEETNSYIRACLQGAGCDWANELIPDGIVFDIQAFTQGVVGDINALCRESLDELAKQQKKRSLKTPKVTGTLLHRVGNRLNLRHNPEAWLRPANEKLSPEAVQVTENWELKINAARLIVSSEGRQIAEVFLNRPRMILGRDSACDISLDSSYLSRYQNLFMETDRGWLLIDLNSTNGCYVNGRRVREHRLKDGDLIGVGQHQIRFSGEMSAAQDTGEHQSGAERRKEATITAQIRPKADQLELQVKR